MMKTRLMAAAAAFLVSTSIVAPATAATITYTLSGNFQGTLNDAAFDTFATFTGIGDTTSYDGLFVSLSSLKAVANGVTYNATVPSYFFNNQSNGIAGFGQYGTGDFFDFTGFGGSYDANTATASTAVTFVSGFGQPFSTDMGTARFSGGSNLSFSASVAAVPEPATWAMMLVGFGMMGASMRYRRKSTAVSFA